MKQSTEVSLILMLIELSSIGARKEKFFSYTVKAKLEENMEVSLHFATFL